LFTTVTSTALEEGVDLRRDAGDVGREVGLGEGVALRRAAGGVADHAGRAADLR
jgi:hypothetical protein